MAWIDRAFIRALVSFLRLVASDNDMTDPTSGERAEQMTARAREGIPEFPSYNDPTKMRKVSHFALSMEHLEAPNEEEDFLSGVVFINGTMFHLGALKVTTDGETVATKDPFDRLSNLYNLYDDMDPMEIPGVEGEWLVWLHPGG